MELQEGMFKITDEEYFSINALSNSFLKAFDRSPGHAFADKEQTAFMRLGKFGHAYLLDEYEYDKLIKAPETYAEMPLANRKNKPWGDYLKAVGDDGSNVILHKEQVAFQTIKDLLLDYHINDELRFGDIYNECKKEMALIYFDPEFEIWIKGKIDLLFPSPDYPIIFDPKFTSNSKKLQKKILDEDLKYYRQAAFYIDLCQKLFGVMPVFYFIGIETAEPYGIDMFDLDKELIERGRYENKLSIQKYLIWRERQKEKERIYPSWEGVTTVHKPGWLKD